MTAVANGMFAYGGVRPFVATFLTFAGYAMGAVRLSALSHFGIIFIMTHDRYVLLLFVVLIIIDSNHDK